MGQITGKLIPGTKHPINYYIQVNKNDYENIEQF